MILSNSQLARFWSKVRVTNNEYSCWEWAGAIDGTGYGQLRINKTSIRAHRQAWEIFNGPIPEGLFACHKCDNRKCCNPFHIFLGTNQQNIDDAKKKGRIPCGEAHHSAKLTLSIVRRVRSLYESGQYTQKQITIITGIPKSTVHQITSRQTWRESESN